MTSGTCQLNPRAQFLKKSCSEGRAETVALVVSEILQITRDLVLKTLTCDPKGHPLTHYVAHRLETTGYHTRVAPPGPDGGVDTVASHDMLCIEPPIGKVQAKAGQGSVGNATVACLQDNIG